MVKWEYTMRSLQASENSMGLFNQMGKLGWELCYGMSGRANSGPIGYIFKRELTREQEAANRLIDLAPHPDTQMLDEKYGFAKASRGEREAVDAPKCDHPTNRVTFTQNHMDRKAFAHCSDCGASGTIDYEEWASGPKHWNMVEWQS